MGYNNDNEATEYRNNVNENTILHDTSAAGNQTPGNITQNQPSVQSAPTGAVPPPYIPKTPSKVQAQPTQKANGRTWPSAVAGAGAGLIIGGLASTLAAQQNWELGEDIIDASSDGDTHRDTLTNPDWVDNDIQVATSVDENMTFGQAFAAARAEIGPGGCFEWHGNVYSTYIAEEWEQMTPDEQAEFNDHFSWNHIDHSSNNMGHNDYTTDSPIEPSDTITTETPSQGSLSVNMSGHEDDVINDSPIEPSDTITTETPSQGSLSVNMSGHEDDVINVTDYEPDVYDPEIEILGVEHDYDLNVNVGSMTVDNQEVFLIDIDGDMEFDYMTMDANGDGQIDESEYVNIQDVGIDVDDLGGFNDPCSEFMDPDDNIDLFDDVYEG